VAANHGDCPLGRLGDPIGDEVPLFELVLPPRAARLAVPILGAVTAGGVGLLAIRSRSVSRLVRAQSFPSHDELEAAGLSEAVTLPRLPATPGVSSLRQINDVSGADEAFTHVVLRWLRRSHDRSRRFGSWSMGIDSGRWMCRGLRNDGPVDD
jgi:hypothetical protein